MRAEWLEEAGGVLAFWIEADTFMRHMVRALVGTMLGVARGPRAGRGVRAAAGRAPAQEAGDTAQPHGLYLEAVRY